MDFGFLSGFPNASRSHKKGPVPEPQANRDARQPRRLSVASGPDPLPPIDAVFFFRVLGKAEQQPARAAQRDVRRWEFGPLWFPLEFLGPGVSYLVAFFSP